MPYLIDGNNLMYALSEAQGGVGRLGLCKLLMGLPARGQRVRVVFDGPEPPSGLARQIEDTGLEVHYSGPRIADDLITEHITADSAPRRLTVVSSDREIRKAASRRRCRIIKSEEFVPMLLRIVESHRRCESKTRRGGEPKEKREGLSQEQTQKWLREFGFDE